MNRAIWKRIRRRFQTGESGSTLLEFALTVPVLFGFLLGLTQVCLSFYTWEFISEAAREGTRYAIVHGSTCETSTGSSCLATAAQISGVVTSIGLPNLGSGTFSASTTFPDGG